MLTCREATQLLSEKQDRTLNFKEMSALQFHVVMCSSCRRFGKQMKSLSLLSKQYKKFDEKQKDYNKKASYFMRLSWFNLY